MRKGTYVLEGVCLGLTEKLPNSLAVRSVALEGRQALCEGILQQGQGRTPCREQVEADDVHFKKHPPGEVSKEPT